MTAKRHCRYNCLGWCLGKTHCRPEAAVGPEEAELAQEGMLYYSGAVETGNSGLIAGTGQAVADTVRVVADTVRAVAGIELAADIELVAAGIGVVVVGTGPTVEIAAVAAGSQYMAAGPADTV